MTEIIIEGKDFSFNTPGVKDSAALRFGRDDRPIRVTACNIDGVGAEWGLKMSKVFEGTFIDCNFKGGSDRAYDQVRGGKVTFRGCTFTNGGTRPVVKSKWALQKQCDVGIKAGVRDITFEDCTMNDILIGDYSIYDQIDRPKARRIKLVGCHSPSGAPIIVRVRYGEPVIAENTEVSQLVWPTCVTSGYWWYNRKFGDKRVISPDEFIIDPEELG